MFMWRTAGMLPRYMRIGNCFFISFIYWFHVSIYRFTDMTEKSRNINHLYIGAYRRASMIVREGKSLRGENKKKTIKRKSAPMPLVVETLGTQASKTQGLRSARVRTVSAAVSRLITYHQEKGMVACTIYAHAILPLSFVSRRHLTLGAVTAPIHQEHAC